MTPAAGSGEETLRARLSNAVVGLGIAATALQCDQLLAYLGLLVQWNGTYNLTAIRTPFEMLTHHLIDSLAVVGPLRRQRAPLDATRLLDVGSGGGLPGVVLAIMDRETDVTCVDAVGKKAAFVQHAAASLGLPNLHARHARVEAMEGEFDVVTSRAFASLRDFVRLSRAQVGPSGVWMAMKGKRPDDEIAAVADCADVFHVEPLALPEAVGERCIVWMRAHPQKSAHAAAETPSQSR